MPPTERPSGAPDQLSREERRRFTAASFSAAAATRDPAERRRLIHEVIVANLEVARSIASRYRSRGIPLEDLQQVASTALVRAAHRFDHAMASDFLAFAVPSIRGEIRRHFRDRGWVVRPPRRVQELQSRVVATRERLRAECGDCSHRGIAEALDVPEAEVIEALNVGGCFTPTSLDAPAGGDRSISVGDAVADPHSGEAAAAAEARMILRPVMRRLSERDRALLRLRFFDERTQKEIGEEFGVTQTQVSRMLTRVLADLRDSLTSPPAR